jgi:hypothetical protein
VQELRQHVPPQPDHFGVVAVSAGDIGKPTYTPVGTTVVAPLPDQMAFILTMDKYDLLSEGNVSSERQARDVSLGIFLGALIGTLSLVGTDAIHWMRFSVLVAIALASGVCWGIFASKVDKAPGAPGYTRVKAEIDAHFGRAAN